MLQVNDMLLEKLRLELQDLIQDFCDNRDVVIVDTYGGELTYSEYSSNLMWKKDRKNFDRDKDYSYSKNIVTTSDNTYKELCKRERKAFCVFNSSENKFVIREYNEEDHLWLKIGTFDDCVRFVLNNNGTYEYV